MAYPVEVFIYDLSQGMARTLGPSLGLPNLEGVWHTSIVVHGTEIFFGGSGIEHCIPGTTMLGQPQEKKSLGNTSIDMNNLTSYLRQIGQTEYADSVNFSHVYPKILNKLCCRFHGTKYDLFKHNCNNFSSSLTKFLGVQDVPSHILALPDYVLSSPIAAILKPIIEQATPDGQGTSFTSSPSMERNGTESTSNASNSGNGNLSHHFPPKEYCVINVPVDVDKVMGKTLSFNEKYGATNRLNDDQLTKLRLLTEPGYKLGDDVRVFFSLFESHFYYFSPLHFRSLKYLNLHYDNGIKKIRSPFGI